MVSKTNQIKILYKLKFLKTLYRFDQWDPKKKTCICVQGC